MAVRLSMQYLIDLVRDHINDQEPDGVFTDQQIQDRLDLNARRANFECLQSSYEVNTDGEREYKEFFHTYPFWEDSAVLQLSDGTVLTPDETSPMVGRWNFDIAPVSNRVYITGRYYDVYKVCSGLLMQMSSNLRTEFNFSVDGLTVDRMSQIKNLQQDATRYAQMAWGGAGGNVIRMVRKDIIA